MSDNLKVLADNRDALLLAEVAAWLHDMGKCSDEMIKWQASDKPQQTTFKNKNHHKTYFSNLLGTNAGNKINLNNESVKLKDLIEQGMPRAIKDSNKPRLIRYLGRCHAAAHIEKEGQADTKQKINDTRLCSPFGYETEPLANLTDKLKNLSFDNIENKKEFLKALKEAFKSAPGDTERPINEVNLWDWSSIVAALYKSALAGALLGNKPEPNDLKWRLLAIRFDSEKVWENASRIPVLLERKKWLNDGLDKAKILLEETYPLGNEVYRDENGSIFVVPDSSDLLKIRDSKEDKTLRELISERLGYEGEVVVSPAIDEEPWWGQNTSGRPDLREDKIPPIVQILGDKPYSPHDPETVKKWWAKAGNPEICTISWIRPQGPTEKGFQRKASDYWAEKVTGRAKDWLQNRYDRTIWIDETADSNGRICLITGKLDISDWLKPEGQIKTLLVKPSNTLKPSNASNDAVTKTPSFARIRRIWETTKAFWDDMTRDLRKSIYPTKQRLKIMGKFHPENSVDQLTKFSAYEAELERVRFSIFYAGGSEYIIIENLQRLAEKMDVTVEQLSGETLKIYDSEGTNRQKPIGHLTATRVEFEPTSYLPAIPILSEPHTFMAIVPANRALEVAKSIKKKYEKEMGKVRNRLPLTLGMVFAKSHTPLAALMDAGRRMLSVPNIETDWILNAAHDSDTERILNFTNGKTWRVPVKMGDGTTEDIWYPYFYVNGVPNGRSTVFRGPAGWLVHVKELKKGDKVKITPSRFDFEFLDTASRRFEVSYDDNGNRRGQMKSERPYLLEELDYFERWWHILSEGLARSQIKNVIGLIETKQEDWLSKEGDDVFENFVHDALHNANWKNGIPTEIVELEKAAISGKLKDTVELYMDILKVPIGEEKQQEVSE